MKFSMRAMVAVAFGVLAAGTAQAQRQPRSGNVLDNLDQYDLGDLLDIDLDESLLPKDRHLQMEDATMVPTMAPTSAPTMAMDRGIEMSMAPTTATTAAPTMSQDRGVVINGASSGLSSARWVTAFSLVGTVVAAAAMA